MSAPPDASFAFPARAPQIVVARAAKESSSWRDFFFRRVGSVSGEAGAVAVYGEPSSRARRSVGERGAPGFPALLKEKMTKMTKNTKNYEEYEDDEDDEDSQDSQDSGA